ncbi:hypothetical protein MT325_m230R [Paramecium bursaria chlorella virus MT325]|uniref:Uncharacterized protein m230R n=1 Tax=Paramecium bursaria Chlorella virus MT325 TaxID=346932 RepID=A7ITW0_PBCVM|nr:hypothetical protein MT325_m230R [Paramecium bursaria chlorella virus MT325]
MIPTLGNFLEKSLNFWFEMAFRGLVYTTFFFVVIDRCTAYSATMVFPLPVGTAANTLWPLSIDAIASFCH